MAAKKQTDALAILLEQHGAQLEENRRAVMALTEALNQVVTQEQCTKCQSKFVDRKTVVLAVAVIFVVTAAGSNVSEAAAMVIKLLGGV